MTIVNLYSNLCSQNPTLINILSENPVLDNIFSILEDSSNVPQNIDSISDIINFYHHVSLKQGEARIKATKTSFKKFLFEMLSSQKFLRVFTMKNFTQFWTTLNRYRTNIHEVDKSLFIALINVIRKVIFNYQLLTPIKNV